jgi:hypothetical protein
MPAQVVKMGGAGTGSGAGIEPDGGAAFDVGPGGRVDGPAEANGDDGRGGVGGVTGVGVGVGVTGVGVGRGVAVGVGRGVAVGVGMIVNGRRGVTGIPFDALVESNFWYDATVQAPTGLAVAMTVTPNVTELPGVSSWGSDVTLNCTRVGGPISEGWATHGLGALEASTVNPAGIVTITQPICAPVMAVTVRETVVDCPSANVGGVAVTLHWLLAAPTPPGTRAIQAPANVAASTTAQTAFVRPLGGTPRSGIRPPGRWESRSGIATHRCRATAGPQRS